MSHNISHNIPTAGRRIAGVVKDDWNGFNVLHDAASRVSALDLGFQPSAAAQTAPPPKLVYLLGADDYADADVPANAFVVYQGHHGDKGAARADVVLPGVRCCCRHLGSALRAVGCLPMQDCVERGTCVLACSKSLCCRGSRMRHKGSLVTAYLLRTQASMRGRH